MKVISLFSGCGGFDLGVLRAGHQIVWANDKSRAAALTYRANFPSVDFQEGDIRDYSAFPKADIVVGCYPCQGYSEGGSRREDDERNTLYREYRRCLSVIRPKAFFAENVAGMTKNFDGRFLSNQLLTFRFLGYRVTWKILNALDFGVAQHRSRVFIVGIRTDTTWKYSFPEPTHGPGLQPYPTLRDSIWDYPRWPHGEYWEEDFHWYYLSRNRRKGWGEYSHCITAHCRHVPLHPMSKPLIRIGEDEWRLAKHSRYRRLSYKECAALQSFPKEFIFPAELSLRDKYWVIGNAVPPVLAEHVVSGLSPRPVRCHNYHE